MKKIKTIILAMVLLLAETSNVFAAIGDIVNYARYTDIKAYINHYIIESYNIDGYTAIPAEDLAYFGFNVVWDEAARTLSITRNSNVNTISNYSVLPYETAPNKIGKISYPVLSTDIKTYVNGNKVTSYNINGRTLIQFESLNAFGGISWSEEYRVIKLWIQDGLGMMSYEQQPKSLPKTTLYSSDGRSISVHEYEVDNYLKVGWYKTKEEANRLKNLEANKSAVQKFRVGQSVIKGNLLITKFGVVRQIDERNGKIKVYWNKVVDSSGNNVSSMTGQLFYALYAETWEDASAIRAS